MLAAAPMPETPFQYQDMLPLGADTTPYRLLSKDHVSTFEAGGKTFLQVAPEALTTLAQHAMRDIAHLLRPGHLAQLRKILDDPEASPNDKFVALDLLKNANIAAGGVLPMCQDTGTAIVMGKKGQYVVTGGGDEEALSRGIYETYRTSNLRYSQMAPLDMYREKNTGSNLPAQIDIFATDGDAYKFLFMAKGGGSANKSYLFQETKALLNPDSLLAFVESSGWLHPVMVAAFQGLLAGRFVIEREVGRGGVGIVYRATDEVSKAPVALKVIAIPGEEARFGREGRVLAGLSHPGIMRVVAFGQLDEEHPYVAMEWLDGEDIAQSRSAHRSLSVRRSRLARTSPTRSRTRTASASCTVTSSLRM